MINNALEQGIEKNELIDNGFFNTFGPGAATWIAVFILNSGINMYTLYQTFGFGTSARSKNYFGMLKASIAPMATSASEAL